MIPSRFQIILKSIINQSQINRILTWDRSKSGSAAYVKLILDQFQTFLSQIYIDPKSILVRLQIYFITILIGFQTILIHAGRNHTKIDLKLSSSMFF